MASPDEVRACLRLLAEAGLKNPPEGERAPEMYALLLSDTPGESLLAAALDHARESMWFPAPAELRQRAMALDGHAEPTGSEAFPRLWRLTLKWRPTSKKLAPAIMCMIQLITRRHMILSELRWTGGITICWNHWQEQSPPTFSSGSDAAPLP